MTPNIDTESIPEAVPKPGFTKVDNLVHLQLSYVVIDLETTGLSKYIFSY
jgi:DNA polymerase III epsilon subunit-like protein